MSYPSVREFHLRKSMSPSAETRKRSLIESALKNFVITPAPETTLINDQIQQWLKQYGIAFEMDWLPTGEARGFKQEGVSSLIELTSVLWKEEPTYLRGTRPERLGVHVAHSIVAVFQDRLGSIPTPDDVVAVEKEIRRRFATTTASLTHCIPCRIIPEHASPFSVGPVKFYSREDMIKREGLSVEKSLNAFAYGPLLEFMNNQSAHWVADVTVEGFDEKAGLERANIAVDLALTAVQIAIPTHYSRQMARLTSCTLPTSIGSVSKVNGHPRFGRSWRDPGLGFSAGAFDQFLLKAASILASIGNRVEAYVTDSPALPRLDQSWSDAAYWLHEGLAEPLETVAVTKLETAIEVLLSAQSSKNSRRRLESAFEAFYGLHRECSYPPDGIRKVKDIVNAVVESRSRILHGTLSTLTAESLATDDHGGRRVLEFLCMDLVATFSLKLDAYASMDKPCDGIEKFLQFVSATRGSLNFTPL
jgi:hypothetical protein